MNLTQVINAIAEALKSLFDCAENAKTRQSETQIIKDKKRLKEATNIAEEIFSITDLYKGVFAQEHLDEYEKLMRKFNKKD